MSRPQADLFAAPEATEMPPHPVVEALDDLEPDEMTPKQALEALYRLKALG